MAGPTNPTGRKTATKRMVGKGKVEKQCRERRNRLVQNVARLQPSRAIAEASVSSSAPNELRVFVQKLKSVSCIAKTKADATLRLYDSLRPIKTTLGILNHIVEGHKTTFREDVTLLEHATDLGNHLARAFELPLLYRATDGRPSLTGADLNLQDLKAHLAGSPHSIIDVYDYSVTDPTQRTYRTDVSKFLASFPSSPSSPALNFLDIENRTGLQFCPQKVKLSDICLDRGGSYVGKTDSHWVGEPSAEFFLASTRDAVSPIHVDTGGANTWIAILSGIKTWYFPRHADEQSVLTLAAAGALAPEHYTKGWVKVELRAGDLLIMPPGLPHAVCTPEDSLTVGGQFYTAANLGRSLRMVRLQEQYSQISNEDLDDGIYERLTRAMFNLREDTQTRATDKLSVAANAMAFEHPAVASPTSSVTVAAMKAQLMQRGVQFDPRAKKAELAALLQGASIGLNNDGAATTGRAREDFLVALHNAAEHFLVELEEDD